MVIRLLWRRLLCQAKFYHSFNRRGAQIVVLDFARPALREFFLYPHLFLMVSGKRPCLIFLLLLLIEVPLALGEWVARLRVFFAQVNLCYRCHWHVYRLHWQKSSLCFLLGDLLIWTGRPMSILAVLTYGWPVRLCWWDHDRWCLLPSWTSFSRTALFLWVSHVSGRIFNPYELVIALLQLNVIWLDDLYLCLLSNRR